MKLLTATALAATMTFSAGAALASCEEGEIVIKFAHVTNTDKHPQRHCCFAIGGAGERRNERCCLYGSVSKLDAV